MYHRRFAFVVLLFGIGLAGAAAIQARQQINAAYASTTVVEEVPTVQVVAFNVDLPRGHVVTPDDLVLVPYVAASTPATFLRDQNAVVGAYLIADVTRGQPAVSNLLSQEPVAMRPQTVTVRRGIEVERVCVARCSDDG